VTAPPLAHRLLPAVIVIVIWSLTTHGKFSDSGDEPHFLMVAESLVADRDFDVENNYTTHDGRWFGADTLEPEQHVRLNRFGHAWPVHDIGLPVLLAPIYVVATRLAADVPPELLARFNQTQGLFAYSIISFALILLTAWAASMLLGGLRRVTNASAGLWTVAALVLSPPVLSHAFLVFPETVAWAVACLVVWFVCLRDEEVTSARAGWVVAAVGLIPWLHRKYSLVELGLLFLILRTHWRWFVAQSRGTLALLTGLALGPQLALHAWTLVFWGRLVGPMYGDVPLSVSGLPSGSLGLLFDRERGLLAYAPVYLLVPACFVLTWREGRRFLVPMLLIFLPMAAYVEWWGGFSPAARYLVPLTPLVALPAARALERRPLRWIAIPVVLFQILISAYIWQHPRALWPKEQATNQALEGIPVIGPLYEHALPSIFTGDSLAWGWACLGALALVTALIVITVRASGELPAVRRQ
jgi:hypothetical protein